MIVSENKIAVVQSARTQKYFLIGGGLDAGETEIEALRREAREEIGFEIEVGEKIGEAIEYFFAENDDQYVAKECHFYRVKLLERSETEAEAELQWLTRGELAEMYHRAHQWIAERELRGVD